MRELKTKLLSVLNPETGEYEEIDVLRGRDGVGSGDGNQFDCEIEITVTNSQSSTSNCTISYPGYDSVLYDAQQTINLGETTSQGFYDGQDDLTLYIKPINDSNGEHFNRIASILESSKNPVIRLKYSNGNWAGQTNTYGINKYSDSDFKGICFAFSKYINVKIFDKSASADEPT